MKGILAFMWIVIIISFVYTRDISTVHFYMSGIFFPIIGVLLTILAYTSGYLTFIAKGKEVEEK